MIDLPARLSRGDRLPAAWLNRLLDALRARELRAGPGIALSRTSSGTTVSLAPGGRQAAAPPAAPCPQWRVTAEAPDSGGGAWRLRCAGGTLWLFGAELSGAGAGAADDADTTYALVRTAEPVEVAAADLGPAATGAVVLRIDSDGSASIVLAAPGGTPPEGSSDVVLATVDVPEDGPPAVRQWHSDTVFFLPPTPGGGEGGGGGPDPSLPPCGHPGNGGSGEDGGPGDGDGYDGAHPGDSHGSGASGSHPGDAEGDDGATPSSGGCDDAGDD